MSALLEVVSWALLLAGSFFSVLAGIGLLRLPDFFSRVHGAGILDTLGIGLLLAGMIVQAGLTMTSVKLVLIALFIVITGPTAAHALARAALHAGLRPPVDRKQPSSSS